jgi:hypothetical protein
MDGVLVTGEQMGNMRHILEVFSMIGVGVEYKSPKKELKEAIASYEEALDGLEKGVDSAEIQTYIKKSRSAWRPLKAKMVTVFGDVGEKAMRESAQFIHDNIRHVIVELIQMKQDFLKHLPQDEREQVNAAVEIGASIKRLSAHYMMKTWGLDDPTIEKHWDRGVEIYTKSLQILKASSHYADPAFKKMLDKSQKSLNHFVTLWGFDGNYMPVLVAKRAKRDFRNAKKILSHVLDKTKP